MMSNLMNLYFDNGSTSYPKPTEVTEAMVRFATYEGGSHGRGAHKRAYSATAVVEECRDLIGQRLGLQDGANIGWAMNATHAANVVISSLDLRGKEVLVSPLEHNCTMRPLVASGAIIKVMPSFSDGRIDISSITKGDAVLAVVNHQSNINGVVQPIEELRSVLDIPLMIDTAQSLGSFPVDVSSMDYAIFTGHKGLMGPMGTGGFYAKDTSSLRPLLHGGTGSNSASFTMPKIFPEAFEVGTQNVIGLVGLKQALECEVVPFHTKDDFLAMLSDISYINGIELFRANDTNYQGELFSFRHCSIDGSEIAYQLDDEYGIECRFGLQCSALAHQTLGTTSTGVVRVSLSKFHTVAEMEYFVKSLAKIINKR